MKQVFFTGATGGLGEACVRALASARGWRVFAGGTSEAKLRAAGRHHPALCLCAWT